MAKPLRIRDAMISIFRKNPTTRLRAIRAYLLVVLVCTLLLFAFSVVSLHEQRRKANALSSSNLRFVGEQIALDLEKRMQLLATDCLSRDTLKNLDFTSQDPSLRKLRTYRTQFDAIKKLHPIAQHFFIFAGNRLIFPRIDKPGPGTPWGFAAPNASPALEKYLKLLTEGERLELISGKPAQAAEAYRAAESYAITDRLKALALLRTAEALNKSGRKPAAMETCRRLVRDYGDQYDELQTPYILALAVGSEECEADLSIRPIAV
jgi:hypothetical protein